MGDAPTLSPRRLFTGGREPHETCGAHTDARRDLSCCAAHCSIFHIEFVLQMFFCIMF